jgi:hypothetical protein
LAYGNLKTKIMNNETPLLEHDLETLLELGEPIFKSIELLISQSKFDEAYRLIGTTPPVPEWLVSYPSLLDPKEKYQTIHLQLLKKIMDRIFGAYQIGEMETPSILESRVTGKFSVTSKLFIIFQELNRTIDKSRYSCGIATDTCDSIEMLRLCTPSSVSLAEKDAIMRIGDLFGRSLNGRGVNKVEDKKESLTEIEKEIDTVTKLMVEGKSYENAQTLFTVYPHLKNNTTLKALADSLPKHKK